MSYRDFNVRGVDPIAHQSRLRKAAHEGSGENHRRERLDRVEANLADRVGRRRVAEEIPERMVVARSRRAQATPQMSGTQVAGLVSCSRIFQFRNSSPVASFAPFNPSSCRMPPLPSSASAFVSAAIGLVPSVSTCIATRAVLKRAIAGLCCIGRIVVGA